MFEWWDWGVVGAIAYWVYWWVAVVVSYPLAFGVPCWWFSHFFNVEEILGERDEEGRLRKNQDGSVIFAPRATGCLIVCGTTGILIFAVLTKQYQWWCQHGLEGRAAGLATIIVVVSLLFGTYGEMSAMAEASTDAVHRRAKKWRRAHRVWNGFWSWAREL